MKRLIILILMFAFLISATVGAQKSIEINIPSRTLKLFNDDRFIKIYPIAVGKPSHDSPIGQYKILNKVVNPTWRPKGQKTVPPGPTNPLGTRWIGFYSDYGIHGNSNPNSIGTFASKGCIRMHNFDVEELFENVKAGNDVNIYYNTIYTYDNPDKSKAALIVYPDLYNKGSNSSARIKQELSKLGLTDQISSQKLAKLNKIINKNMVIFAKGWTLFVNGEYISPDTKMKTTVNDENTEKVKLPISEEVLVNIYDINLHFGLDLKIDESGSLGYKGMPIYYEIQDGIPYVSVLDSIRAIEGYYDIDFTQEKINWIISYGKLDGKFFRLNIKTTGHEVYAWVKDIAESLGLQVEWNEEKHALFVDGKEIKGKIIDEKMYITPKQVKEYFGLDSSYSSYQNRLELFSTQK